MFRATCPHCGNSWRSAVAWRGAARCPKCGQRRRAARAPDPGSAKTAAAGPAPARRWPPPFGGPLSQIAFVVVVIVFFAVLVWLVVPPLVDFWSQHAEQIEEQAAPP